MMGGVGEKKERMFLSGQKQSISCRTRGRSVSLRNYCYLLCWQTSHEASSIWMLDTDGNPQIPALCDAPTLGDVTSTSTFLD